MGSSGKQEKRVRNNFSADEERLAQFFARHPQHPHRSKITYEMLLQEWARYHTVASWLGRYMGFERKYEKRIAEIVNNGGGGAHEPDGSGRESSKEAESSVERPKKRRRRDLQLESEPDSDEDTGSFKQFPVHLNEFTGKIMSQADQYIGLNLAITHLSMTHGFPATVVYTTWELTGNLHLTDELLRLTKLSLGRIPHGDGGSGEPSASQRVGVVSAEVEEFTTSKQSVENVHPDAGRYPEPVPQSQLRLPPHVHLPPLGREISADFEAYRPARRVPTAQESVVPETPQVSERGDSPPPPPTPQEAHETSSSESGDTSAPESGGARQTPPQYSPSSSSSSSSSFYGSQYQEPATQSTYIRTQTSLFVVALPEAPVVSYISSISKNRKAARVFKDSRMYHTARLDS
ncbi:hypothetical protein C8J57DRAFT_1511485 [Mycena rebaudengoi]|nr:hypothetical protein C8J57DRAFT_1511485 [Mycena rebaudengoi]